MTNPSKSERDRMWYEDNGIELHTGTRIVRINTAAKRVYTDHGDSEAYDTLILAS